MINVLRRSAIVIALLVVVACQVDQSPYPTAESLEDATAMATAAGTLIVLDLTADN